MHLEWYQHHMGSVHSGMHRELGGKTNGMGGVCMWCEMSRVLYTKATCQTKLYVSLVFQRGWNSVSCHGYWVLTMLCADTAMPLTSYKLGSELQRRQDLRQFSIHPVTELCVFSNLLHLGHSSTRCPYSETNGKMHDELVKILTLK